VQKRTSEKMARLTPKKDNSGSTALSKGNLKHRKTILRKAALTKGVNSRKKRRELTREGASWAVLLKNGEGPRPGIAHNEGKNKVI